jgi:hypothetical protein
MAREVQIALIKHAVKSILFNTVLQLHAVKCIILRGEVLSKTDYVLIVEHHYGKKACSTS